MRSSDRPSKLFVGEIGDNRKSDISRLFSKYGEISTIYVDDYKHFAFVEFTSASDAHRALKHTHNKTVNGARLRVEYAKPDKPMRDSRRPSSRERSPNIALYNHLQVTANRLPSMQSVRQSFHPYHPSSMMVNSSMSRGRSLTPPSLKQNARVPSMNHSRTHDFYPPYYPPHPAMFSDPAYFRTYGDPYLMQRLPPDAFLPPRSSPPSTSSSSRAYRNMHPSSNSDRYSPVSSRKRTRRSRSPNRRRNSTSRRNRSSRERKRPRRIPSPSSPQQRRERGPQTPPPSTSSSSHRSKKTNALGIGDLSFNFRTKSSTPSASDDEQEEEEDQQSNSKKI